MPNNLILPHMDDLPPYDSDFFNGLANELWNKFIYCRDSRLGLERKWQQSDEGYFAKRYLPRIGSVNWVIDGDMGETDLHDIVNLIAIRLTQAAMPRNRQWVKVTSRKWDSPDVIQAIQDQQLYLHELAQTRRNMKRFIMQQIIRGGSAVYVRWENRYRLKRAGRAETRRRAADMFEEAGMDRKQAKKLFRGRVRELDWAGPRVECLDNYDVFTHPCADVLNDTRPFTVIQRFRRLAELFAEKDEYDEPVYENMGTKDKPEIVPYDAAEIWNHEDFSRGRVATQEILGYNPSNQESGDKIVPVYVFFVPYLEWEGEEFWDCYFHVARSRSGRGVRIIRYEENDSDMGWNRVIFDNYTDWITPGNFGVSPVWMSLSKWDQLNIIEALTVQSLFSAVYPAYLVNDQAFINPNEISFAPGYVNPIDAGIDPKLAVTPVPTPMAGVNLGEQGGRIWSEKLRAQMNVDGLAAVNPTKTSQSRRTATEINANSTAGSIFLDNQADQLTGVLTRVCQIVYDDSRQNTKPDPWGFTTYDRWVNSNADRMRQQMQLSVEDLDLERSITVSGFMGVMNEDQELERLMRALEVSAPLLQAMPMEVIPFLSGAYERLMAQLHIEPKQPQMPQGIMPQQMGMATGGGQPGAPGAGGPPPQGGGMPPPQGMPPQGMPPQMGGGIMPQQMQPQGVMPRAA